MKHKKILDRIGGTTDIAESLGVPSQAVSTWKKRGIPWKYRTAIVEMATFKIPADFLRPKT